MAGSITSSGLVSGIDTASIVDQLVALESRPITLLQKQQSGFKNQVSILGSIVSTLADLQTAAADLGTNGVLSAQVDSSNTGFTATPGKGALAGRYSVRVDQIAQASKWRSAAFDSGASGVLAGTLQLSIKGTSYPTSGPITITDGMSLADVAYAIRQSGAPVSATVLTGWDTVNAKTVSYLSITARDTGFDTASGAASALQVQFTAGTGTGQDPGFAETQAAKNAAFNVDGVDFVRQSNTVTDAITGLTLALKQGAISPSPVGVTEDLVLSGDATATQAKLQKFVDAYNGVMSLVQQQLNVNKDTDRLSTLAGDPAMRGLQSALHSILTNVVSGLPGVRTLADAGVKTGRDGTLSIDATTFASALSRDPAALDSLFSTPGSGLSAFVANLVKQQTDASYGVLIADQKGLNARSTAIDDQIAVIQRRVDAYKANLVRQFTAMESVLSNLKATSNYMTSQAAANAKTG
jgi:flagellar hook-associated protein 2